MIDMHILWYSIGSIIKKRYLIPTTKNFLFEFSCEFLNELRITALENILKNLKNRYRESLENSFSVRSKTFVVIAAKKKKNANRDIFFWYILSEIAVSQLLSTFEVTSMILASKI